MSNTVLRFDSRNSKSTRKKKIRDKVEFKNYENVPISSSPTQSESRAPVSNLLEEIEVVIAESKEKDVEKDLVFTAAPLRRPQKKSPVKMKFTL
jgi:hypothetical protein